MVQVNTHNLKIEGKVRLIFTDAKTGEVEITEYIPNLIPTVGRAAIARRLGNIASESNEGMITYGAVGTGTTAPLNTDTQLETELIRKQIAYANNTDNIIILRTFYATSEANGDLKEYGLFGEDATGAADSGTLFERVAIDRTKTAAKTLTIETVITIS